MSWQYIVTLCICSLVVVIATSHVVKIIKLIKKCKMDRECVLNVEALIKESAIHKKIRGGRGSKLITREKTNKKIMHPVWNNL